MNITAPIAVCPECGAPAADLRGGKKNPKAPDFRCVNSSCKGAFWLSTPDGTRPSSNGTARPASVPVAAAEPPALLALSRLYRQCIERVADDITPALIRRGYEPDTGFLHAAAATLMIAVQRNGAR